MKVGIIGPTRIDKFCEVTTYDKTEYTYFLHELGVLLAKKGLEIMITPSYTSAPGFVAQVYRDFKGKKVWGLIPEDDTEFGWFDLDFTLADEKINCGTWRNQPESFCQEADIFICVGLSTGTMIELCYSKWFKMKKVFILTDFLSSKLHPEIEKDLDIEYIQLSELGDKL
jgi:predicted Rossmann-fold nucleotide-binding protein